MPLYIRISIDIKLLSNSLNRQADKSALSPWSPYEVNNLTASACLAVSCRDVRCYIVVN